MEKGLIMVGCSIGIISLLLALVGLITDKEIFSKIGIWLFVIFMFFSAIMMFCLGVGFLVNCVRNSF